MAATIFFKDIIPKIKDSEDQKTFLADIDALFPKEDAVRTIIDSDHCTLFMFLDILTKKLEFYKPQINAHDKSIADTVATIGTLFAHTVSYMQLQKLFRDSDQFATYCDNFCQAAGNFADGMATGIIGILKDLALKTIKEAISEISN